MHTTVRFLILAMGLLACRLTAQVTIYAATYGSGRVQTVDGKDQILTTDTSSTLIISVQNGANITYSSNVQIKLEPGFHAFPGSRFHAEVDSDGDGIPDLWETNHGLNPHLASDATNLDTDGRTFLLDYQLGIQPVHSLPVPDSVQAQLKILTPR